MKRKNRATALGLALAVGLPVLTGLPYAGAEPTRGDVIFHCEMRDGAILDVTRNAATDVFTLAYGTVEEKGVHLISHGNNLGTALHQSQSVGAMGREVYFTRGNTFYTVGYIDNQGKTAGYIHVTETTTEVVYENCLDETVRSQFGDYTLFESLTQVD